eukprot:4446886-Ditylum_brightwellii.AAC.1
MAAKKRSITNEKNISCTANIASASTTLANIFKDSVQNAMMLERQARIVKGKEKNDESRSQDVILIASDILIHNPTLNSDVSLKNALQRALGPGSGGKYGVNMVMGDDINK